MVQLVFECLKANIMKSACVIFVLLCTFACYVASAATGDIVEPCGSNNIDIECVRQYFEENGVCSVVCQPDEAPVSKERGVSYIPLVNATAIDVNSTLRNLNGPIRKFYVNNTSGNLVYSMNMNDVSFYSPSFTFYIHQMDGEPLIVSDEITETFPDTVLTAVIPLDNSKITIKSMLESITTAYFLSESGAISIGPNIAENDDPRVQAALAGIFGNRPISLREIFVTEGPLRFRAYLQKYVCDFGLPIRALYS